MNDTSGEEQPQLSEATPASTQQAPDKPKHSRKTKKSGAGLAFLALVLALAALGLSGYLGYIYYQYKTLFTPLAVTTIEQSNRVTEQLLSEINDLEIRQEASVDTQNALRDAIAKINDELGRDRKQWVLAETEQLLIIANHRLQLAHDVDTSLAALKTADHQLRALGLPKLLVVRKAIAEEIATLSALERTDLAGLSLQLGGLADTIDRLPVAMMRFSQEPKPATGASGTTPATTTDESVTQDMAATAQPVPAADTKPGFFTQAWRDILGLVRIRTNIEDYKPLLAPEQSYYLRENLRLMLSGAQLALLSGHRQIYQDNIQRAHGWITQNFDQDSQAVARILNELDALAGIQIVTDLPDISTSLELLREIMQQQDAS